MPMRKTDAQRRAQKKYIQKGRFINLFFTEAELPLFNRLEYLGSYYGVPKAQLIKKILRSATENTDSSKEDLY